MFLVLCLNKRFLVGGLTAAILLNSGISVALADTNLGENDFVTYDTNYQAFAIQVPGHGATSTAGQTPQQTKPIQSQTQVCK